MDICTIPKFPSYNIFEMEHTKEGHLKVITNGNNGDMGYGHRITIDLKNQYIKVGCDPVSLTLLLG